MQMPERVQAVAVATGVLRDPQIFRLFFFLPKIGFATQHGLHEDGVLDLHHNHECQA